MRLVLVHPIDSMEPIDLFRQRGYNLGRSDMPNLGMLYVASNLDKSHQVSIIDNKLERLNDENLFNKITKQEPDVVGFSGTIMEMEQAVSASRLLRKEGIITVYGGPNASLTPEKFANDFDFIVVGEGEVTFNELLNTLEVNRKVDDIKGICYIKPNGFKINEPRPFIRILDSLQFPNRDLIPLEKYPREFKGLMHSKPIDVIASSRGCPFNCSFCSSRRLWQGIYRYRSAENVEKEIVIMKEKYGTEGIFFREDNFTANRKHLLEMCKMLKRQELEWRCESRVDTVNKEILQEMKDSGCSSIMFGVESGSEKTLKYFRKGYTTEKAKKAVKWTKEVGMAVAVSLILGAPCETKEDIKKTIKLGFNLWPDHLYFYRFMSVPVNDTYYQMKEENLVTLEWNDWGIGRTRYVTDEQLTHLYLSALRQYQLRKGLKDRDINALASLVLPLSVKNRLKRFIGDTS